MHPILPESPTNDVQQIEVGTTPAVTSGGTTQPNDVASPHAATTEGEGGTTPQTPGEVDRVDHFAALSAAMPENTLDNTIARVVAAGGVDGVTFDPVGGMSQEDFTTHAAGHQAALQSIADQHVAALGHDAPAVWSWAQQHMPKDVRSLALEFAHGRNPASLNPIIAAYARSNRK